MTQERETQRNRQATANHGHHELTEAELAHVAGGGGGPVDPTDKTGKASPQLF
jgi:hypothetical protein